MHRRFANPTWAKIKAAVQLNQKKRQEVDWSWANQKLRPVSKTNEIARILTPPTVRLN